MTRAVANKLDMVKAHKLVSLLLAEFTESNLSYRQFAEHATDQLGFPVTAQQVQTRCEEFEIPKGTPVANPDMQAMGAMLLAHEQKIQGLQERMTLLEAWVRETFPSKGLRAVV